MFCSKKKIEKYHLLKTTFGNLIWDIRFKLNDFYSIFGMMLRIFLSIKILNSYWHEICLKFSNNKMTSEEDDFFTYRLLMLSSKGDLEGLQSLFNHNSNIDVNKRDYDNRTALHLAVEEGLFIL